MTNQYPGRCGHCGQTLPAGAGELRRVDGRWVVYHAGECPEITSGLGIGGIGSDDYNSRTERDTPLASPRRPEQAGARYAPAGTTQGIRTPGARCSRCRREADWNPGAGEYLCEGHWDEY